MVGGERCQGSRFVGRVVCEGLVVNKCPDPGDSSPSRSSLTPHVGTDHGQLGTVPLGHRAIWVQIHYGTLAIASRRKRRFGQ